MTALILYRPAQPVAFGRPAAFNWQVTVTALVVMALFAATGYTTFVRG